MVLFGEKPPDALSGEKGWIGCSCGIWWEEKLGKCPACGFDPGKIDFRDPVEILKELDEAGEGELVRKPSTRARSDGIRGEADDVRCPGPRTRAS